MHIDLEHLFGSQQIDDSVPVILNPINTLEQPRLRVERQQQPLREPAICLVQFDSVVRNRIWRSVIKHMREEKCTDDEVRAFQICFLRHADICE
jgi:hypothetical protein